MAGNPREHVKDKGFWDGGTPAHGKNGETSGRPSGFPGTRKPGQRRTGIRTDLEFPPDHTTPARD
jgi:hypothetical protein